MQRMRADNFMFSTYNSTMTWFFKKIGSEKQSLDTFNK